MLCAHLRNKGTSARQTLHPELTLGAGRGKSGQAGVLIRRPPLCVV